MFNLKNSLPFEELGFVYSSNVSSSQISFQLYSSVFALDFHLYLRLCLTFQKVLEMVLYALGQYSTLNFIGNIRRNVTLFCC